MKISKIFKNDRLSKSLENQIEECSKQQIFIEPLKYAYHRYPSVYQIRMNHLNKYLLQQHNVRIRQTFKSEINACKNSEIELHLEQNSVNSRRSKHVLNI
jgi:hypothetical protein